MSEATLQWRHVSGVAPKITGNSTEDLTTSG